MAFTTETRKVLGQSYPTAAILTTLYTVPGSTQAVCSSVTACNQATYAVNIRISVAVAGAADEAKQYVFNDVELKAKETKSFTIGMTLGPADVVRCYSDLGTVSFNLFGVEIV